MNIHKHKEWPPFAWNKELVGEKLNEVNRAVGYLMGRFSVISQKERMSAMVESITQDIIASSEIDGVELNGEQVRSVVARRLGVELQNPTEPSHHVERVVEMALDANVNFDTPLTHERLFGWHNSLFADGCNGTTKTDAAKYRSVERKVVSGMAGRKEVHYVVHVPGKIEEEMDCFLEWFNSDSNNGYVKSAIAHLWFVTIRPFDDGNGRIGRAIADMALSKAEEREKRFYSISQQINNEREAYYDMLEKAQKGDCEITEWIVWYLDCLICSIEQSEESLSKILNKVIFWQTHSETVMSVRQREVLNRYLNGCPDKLTTRDWAKHADVSQETASRDIKELVDKGILVPQQWRIRNVFYGIRCNESILFVPMGEEHKNVRKCNV